jgi:hypothetical protein
MFSSAGKNNEKCSKYSGCSFLPKEKPIEDRSAKKIKAGLEFSPFHFLIF